jgi:hypothetical protein
LGHTPPIVSLVDEWNNRESRFSRLDDFAIAVIFVVINSNPPLKLAGILKAVEKEFDVTLEKEWDIDKSIAQKRKLKVKRLGELMKVLKTKGILFVADNERSYRILDSQKKQFEAMVSTNQLKLPPRKVT